MTAPESVEVVEEALAHLFRRYWKAITMVSVGLTAFYGGVAVKVLAQVNTVAETSASRDSVLTIRDSTLDSRIDGIKQEQATQRAILNAVGIDLCQKKSDDFILAAGLPCDRILAPLQRQNHPPRNPPGPRQ